MNILSNGKRSSFSILADYGYQDYEPNMGKRREAITKAIKIDGKTRVLKSLKSYLRVQKGIGLYPDVIRNLNADINWIEPEKVYVNENGEIINRRTLKVKS